MLKQLNVFMVQDSSTSTKKHASFTVNGITQWIHWKQVADSLSLTNFHIAFEMFGCVKGITVSHKFINGSADKLFKALLAVFDTDKILKGHCM